MASSTFGLALFSAQIIGLAFLLAALLAPAYHYESFVLPGGINAVFQLSLFNVKVTSTCVPVITNSFLNRGVMESNSCRRFVENLNGHSLKDVSDTLCGIQFLAFELPATGCVEFSRLWMASILAIVFWTVSITCCLIALVLVSIFFVFRPTTIARKGILSMQIGALLFSTLSMFFYIVVGGTLRPQIFLGNLFGSHYLDHSGFSYGAGAAVGLSAVIWSWSLPLWSIWAVKLKYCQDYLTEQDEWDEEAAELMSDIRREAAKLDPQTAQSIINPVSAEDIINWYTASH